MRSTRRSAVQSYACDHSHLRSCSPYPRLLRAEDALHERFELLDQDGSGEIDLAGEQTFTCGSKMMQIRSSLVITRDLRSDSTSPLRVAPLSEWISWALQDAFERSAPNLIDIFEEWDVDGNANIDREEFREAVRSCAFSCPLHEHETRAASPTTHIIRR